MCKKNVDGMTEVCKIPVYSDVLRAGDICFPHCSQTAFQHALFSSSLLHVRMMSLTVSFAYSFHSSSLCLLALPNNIEQ